MDSLPDPESTQLGLRQDLAAELAAVGLAGAREVGRGGFGVVYRCVQTELDRVVAVKVLNGDIDDVHRERFVREERAMGKLSGHPNIVDILQVDTTFSGRPYIVMPYHARGSLGDIVRTQGPLDWPEATRIVVKLAGAVESAHRVGILHRDVKPANVLLTSYGEPQLTDFGIARVNGGFQTSTGLIAGSPAFIAPEVLRGREPTPASDVYSLGATLFCLLTGHAAFERQSGEKIVAQFLRITEQPIPDLRDQDIPADVAAVIESTMATDPRGRPDTAAELGALLREVQQHLGLPADEMALQLDADEAPMVVTAPMTTERAPRPTWTQTLPRPASAKFRPPKHAWPPLERARLIRRLRAGRDRKLTVIHAPAGYGKTTLAAQWREVLLAEGIPVAWLCLGRDDDNDVRFTGHLVEAVRRAQPELGGDLDAELQRGRGGSVQYVLSTLIDQIESAGTPMAIVLDDWHTVTAESARAAMDYLVLHARGPAQLIVTSRTQTTLGLNDRRARDEVTEIDALALRLTAEETRELLVERHGRTLGFEQLARFHAATEGWPAAVQLVALSLRDRVDADELLDRISGEQHAIAEYLTDNVLAGVDPALVEFLTAVSVAHRVDPALAMALSGESDGDALLRAAEQANLFLYRTLDDPEWFRFQPLFADYLRARLERRYPGRRRGLHLKASRWFAEHQMLRESVAHAKAAAGVERAMDLLESGGQELLTSSPMSGLIKLVSKLPGEPGPNGRQLLGRFGGLLSRGDEVEPEQAARARRSAALRAADQVRADRDEGLVELVADCLTHPDREPVWVVSVAADVTAYASICAFDFAGARAVQDRAMPYHRAAADPLGQVYGLCYQGIAAREQLDVAGATDSFDQALQAAEDRAGARSHGALMVTALAGQAAYLAGDLTTAEAMLDESLRSANSVGLVDFMIATYVIGARVKAIRGDAGAARERLRRGAAVAADRRLPRLAVHVYEEQARLGLADGSPPTVPAATGGVAGLTAEVAERVRIRQLLMADRAIDAARRARALHDRVGRHDRPLAAVEARILYARCLAAADQRDEAAQVLAPAVAACDRTGWSRLLDDAGPEIATLRGRSG
ncbi:serine/threonine-protein kinase [Skermania piniformis]|uniref:non-specific serine/threonine protein kinase n=1 Tax=Skermania pinensis TaxID=39122 RepID=A0ABX8S8P1_9ACTN|nr:serine/threonine-protein kinase [Skermania piniformis]QXQ14143.1 protein kinase [Skermania piniformis]